MPPDDQQTTNGFHITQKLRMNAGPCTSNNPRSWHARFCLCKRAFCLATTQNKQPELRSRYPALAEMEVDWEARYLAEIASRERLEEEVARLRQRYRQERKRRKAANTKLVQYGCRFAHYLTLQPNCSTLTYRSFSTGAESDASTSDSGDSVGSEKYVPSSATVAPPLTVARFPAHSPACRTRGTGMRTRARAARAPRPYWDWRARRRWFSKCAARWCG